MGPISGRAVSCAAFRDSGEAPAYYKTKHRCVCLDEEIGQVYGVSYSWSRPLKKEIAPFGEIEIEFWSRIVKAGETAEMDENACLKLIRFLYGSRSEHIKSAAI